MENILEKLQSLDEAVKKKILIVATIVIMAAVIYLWLGYFNNLIASLNNPQQETASVGSGFNIWDSLRGVGSVAYQSFMDKARAFGGMLAGPREYIIKPPMQ